LAAQLYLLLHSHLLNYYFIRISQLEDENSQVSNLRSKVLDLENKLTREAALRRKSIEERDRIVEKLRENLRRSEEHLEKLRDEEIRRANLLQQAVMSYVSGVQASRSATSTNFS